MPLPFVLLGAAVIAGGTGVISGGMGAKKMKDAQDIVNRAERKYKRKVDEFERVQENTQSILEEFGQYKLGIWKDFKKFSDAYRNIKAESNMKSFEEDDLSITNDEAAEINQISVSAIGILKDVVASTSLGVSAGALAGIAAYSGTMSLGAASTGAAISSLSGVAASNATLAALGGGALSAGGGGIALGTTVLGGVIAGPIIAVGGLVLNAKGNSSLEKAEEVESQVNKVVDEMDYYLSFYEKLESLVRKLKDELELLRIKYNNQVLLFKMLTEMKNDYSQFNDLDKKILRVNIGIIRLLKHLTQLDLVINYGGKDAVNDSYVIGEIEKSEIKRMNLLE